MLSTLWTDLVDSLLPTAHADEPQDDVESQDSEEESKDEDEDEEEDEEDEDEVQDPLDSMREELLEGACKEAKHHFDECEKRVTAEQQEEGYADKEYKEDCVEEFFHLCHCIDERVAQPLFSKLK